MAVAVAVDCQTVDQMLLVVVVAGHHSYATFFPPFASRISVYYAVGASHTHTNSNCSKCAPFPRNGWKVVSLFKTQQR